MSGISGGTARMVIRMPLPASHRRATLVSADATDLSSAGSGDRIRFSGYSPQAAEAHLPAIDVHWSERFSNGCRVGKIACHGSRLYPLTAGEFAMPSHRWRPRQTRHDSLAFSAMSQHRRVATLRACETFTTSSLYGVWFVKRWGLVVQGNRVK